MLFHKLQCFSNTTITLLKVHKTNIASILFKRKTVHKKCLRPSYKLNVHICMYTFLYVYIIYIYISFTYTYFSIGNVCRWLIVCVISVRYQGTQKIQVSRKNIELFDRYMSVCVWNVGESWICFVVGCIFLPPANRLRQKCAWDQYILNLLLIQAFTCSHYTPTTSAKIADRFFAQEIEIVYCIYVMYLYKYAELCIYSTNKTWYLQTKWDFVRVDGINIQIIDSDWRNISLITLYFFYGIRCGTKNIAWKLNNFCICQR